MLVMAVMVVIKVNEKLYSNDQIFQFQSKWYEYKSVILYVPLPLTEQYGFNRTKAAGTYCIIFIIFIIVFNFLQLFVT